MPRRVELDSWLCLLHEVELLRLPLLFGRAHADFITLSEGGPGAVATKRDGYSFRGAASKVVPRSGRHFVQFTVLEGDYMMFGVVRPGWDAEGGANAHREDGHCFYFTGDGNQPPHLGGDAVRGAGRSHRHVARPRSGQHDRLEERREVGGDGGRGAERSALLGGVAEDVGTGIREGSATTTDGGGAGGGKGSDIGWVVHPRRPTLSVRRWKHWWRKKRRRKQQRRRHTRLMVTESYHEFIAVFRGGGSLGRAKIQLDTCCVNRASQGRLVRPNNLWPFHLPSSRFYGTVIAACVTPFLTSFPLSNASF